MISPLRIVGVPLLFLAGVLATSLLVAATVLAVPTSDIPRLALVLLGTGVVVELCVMLLTRPVILRRVGSVRGQLVGASLTGGLLLLGMVVAGALAMFISFHDLSILLTMVLFASLLAIGLGVRGAAPLARRIERIREGTTQLASGEFGTRLPVDGRDEIAGLADDFNRMAQALEEATAHERRIEQARRNLIAAVSHDLRTPLAAVLALIEAISNALRHTPTGGMIFLRAEPRGEVVQVEVADMGEGIDPGDLPYVFDRSFRGEESRTCSETEGVPGAGLGLTIARAGRSARRYDGRQERHRGRYALLRHITPGIGNMTISKHLDCGLLSYIGRLLEHGPGPGSLCVSARVVVANSSWLLVESSNRSIPATLRRQARVATRVTLSVGGA